MSITTTLKTWFALLALFIAPLAFGADQLNLSGKDAWDLYVYGNGEAIAQILTSVKLMLAPEHGGGAFRYLLLCLAMIGFIILAVRAGFNPAQNFLKMFGFILLIWFVIYGTQGARSNVHVYDRYTNYSNVITGVPAIVAIPASMISITGEWLTQQIEQNFSIPGSLKVSEGGQFNLFGKVLDDMNKFVISDPDLKRTVNAYVSDCAVPAIALGRLSTKEIVRTSNLVESLKKARSPALMTRYYVMTPEDGVPAVQCPHLGTTASAQLGTLMSCTQAYECMSGDLAVYGEALLNGSNKQWQATGVMVPFEQAMTDALAQAGASGSAAPLSRYSRPQGIILQKALSSHMSGAFRDAAARTGNNELMMATAIAQAEQSQKTAWWTASEIFKNMMGYVYIVLQAFIFAIVPMVIIALMIPGLGGKISVNYFQILVWLMLWTPMLAIVSFLVTLFGGASMRETLSVIGLSMENSAVISEATNSLIIAAQFIGTMVPLITWGLVKGAMAFTEFVSSGIGSSFATQAGAQAATGNVSMGNLSMDNVGVGKYSTVMSSSVGTQQVTAGLGTGAVLSEAQRGGATLQENGTNATPNTSLTESWKVSNGSGTSSAMSKEQAYGTVASIEKGMSQGRSASQEVSSLVSQLESLNTTDGFQTQEQIQSRQEAARAVSQAAEATHNLNSVLKGGVSMSVTAGTNPLSWGAKGEGKVSYDVAAQKNHVDKLSEEAKASIAKVHSADEAVKSGTDHSQTASESESRAAKAGFSNSVSNSQKTASSANETLKAADSMASDWKVTHEVGQTDSVSTSSGASYRAGGAGGSVREAVSSGVAHGGVLRGQMAEQEATIAAAVAGAQASVATGIQGAQGSFDSSYNELNKLQTRGVTDAGLADLKDQQSAARREGADLGSEIRVNQSERSRQRQDDSVLNVFQSVNSGGNDSSAVREMADKVPGGGTLLSN